MGTYDEKVIELYRAGKTPKEIQEILGISRATEYAARKRAGLVTARRREVKILEFVPETRHQRQYAYLMIKALERIENRLPVPAKTMEKVKQFSRGLERRVWLYDREGRGFYWAPREDKHNQKIVIEI